MTMPNAQLLATYPRKRPPLPAAQAAVYEQEYAINRAGRGPLYRAVRLLESWMHRKIAKEHTAGAILELGAGGLTHLPIEKWCDQYDVVEPASKVVQASENFGRLGRYRDSYAGFVNDAFECELRYSKVFSVAVLEHLTNLPAVVAASALALTPDGSFQAGIPMEGGAMWGASWRLTTGVAYRIRTKASYSALMRHEHINNADEILDVIRGFFGDVKVSRFPLSGRHVSMYAYICARQPRTRVARSYLRRVGTSHA